MKYLSISQAAELIGCSSETLRNYARKGILLPDLITEKKYRKYSVETINKFISEKMEGRVL